MKYQVQRVTTRLGDVWQTHKSPSAQRAFRCRCGRPVYFPNSRCLACGTPLGYEPGRAAVLAMQATEIEGLWRLPLADDAAQTLFRRCSNFTSAAGCNWLLPAPEPGRIDQGLCRACRLNRTIPDLSDAQNALWWGRVEQAKRRLVSSLIALGLPVASRIGEDGEAGLAFDLLRPLPGGAPVIIGHRNGIITLNVEEADDARREALRTRLDEPYRTVLGHLRHEVGHYYWQRLVAGSPWHAPFRALFGDERADYAGALGHHYEHGPAPDWALSHVSAYASLHPWEDWAETWAHYLHMVDTLDTALSFGLAGGNSDLRYQPFTELALPPAERSDGGAFLSFVNAWMELTGVLNELSRSMGLPDFYPFVLPAAAVGKLHFVHRVVQESAQQTPRAPRAPAGHSGHSGEFTAPPSPLQAGAPE